MFLIFIYFEEMEKAKHEYQDLQKMMQQIATKNINEKSKLEKYKLITLYFTKSTICFFVDLVNIEKNAIWPKLILIHFNKKKKQYRELMIKLTGNSEKKYIHREMIDSNRFLSIEERKSI